jgi:antirestriction protein ArdC
MAVKAKVKVDIKEMITQQVIEALETKGKDWNKSWTSSTCMPVNIKSKKAYSGLNVVLLTLKSMAKEYKSNTWGTFAQITAAGGEVIKGSKSTPITYYTTYETTKDGELGKAFVLKYYNVFNLDQTSLADDEKFKPKLKTLTETSKEIQSMLDNYDCKVQHFNQDRAFYRVSNDTVTMPLKEQFNTINDYHSVLLHEVVHSTGAKHRLDRVLAHQEERTQEERAFEELIAELGSMFLGNYFNTSSSEIVDGNVCYIKSWLKALKNDKNYIFKASRDASKAFKFLIPTCTEDEAIEATERELQTA